MSFKRKPTDENRDYHKGRGAQIDVPNKFISQHIVRTEIEAIDEWETDVTKNTYYEDHPKNIVNKVESPDVPQLYSINPYQGCEHGCVYCYARNSHQYWGFNAGLDFERKIIIKKNAPQLFRAFLSKKNWNGTPICISGNTDCYQPIEKKEEITRRILATALEFNQPMQIITKNFLITRDLDILQEMSKKNLVAVFISITGIDEDIRSIMEPRTSTYEKRFEALQKLSEVGVPCGVMMAPVIPAINHHAIPMVLTKAKKHGATRSGYTVVRLNEHIETIFVDWLQKNFPDRQHKVLNQIKQLHGGSVGDSRFSTRMSGEGEIAKSIHDLFHVVSEKLGLNERSFQLNSSSFEVPSDQLKLF